VRGAIDWIGDLTKMNERLRAEAEYERCEGDLAGANVVQGIVIGVLSIVIGRRRI
jgi:hypothetical protein